MSVKGKLGKELEKQDAEELLRLVKEMAARFPVAKMYLQMEFGLESETTIARYKKLLLKEYFPSRGHGKARSSRVNRTLKEFSQIAAFQEDIVEMRFYQVEQAVAFYKAYLHDYDPFISNLLKNWQLVVNMLHREGLVATYEPRVYAMLDDRFQRYWLGSRLMEIWTQGPELTSDRDDSRDDD